MLQKFTLLLTLVASLAHALPVRREVPQEHSHEPFLTSTRASLALNNPANIQDPVFALLGNAAAAAGAGKITDVDCLQQAVADQAFTNSKANNDIPGMVDALIFRALERNSGKVGQTTAACTSIKAVNPEIAAIQQHQDPASANAAAVNKAIVLELARQIKAVGGDPLDALKSGTFAPGNLNDATARGNTCDDTDDPNGCIFTKNLLVPDATSDEILAAVGGDSTATTSQGAAASTSVASTSVASTASASATSADSASTSSAASGSSTETCASAATVTVTAQSTVTVTVDSSASTGTAAATVTVTGSHTRSHAHTRHTKAASSTTAAGSTSTAATATASSTATATDSSTATATDSSSAASASASASATAAAVASTTAAAGANLQTFTGALGGAAPPAVTTGDRGFVVEGSDSFLNVGAALGRSCDIQHNQCANVANSATGRSSGLTVGQCDQQNTACRAASA